MGETLLISSLPSERSSKGKKLATSCFQNMNIVMVVVKVPQLCYFLLSHGR